MTSLAESIGGEFKPRLLIGSHYTPQNKGVRRSVIISPLSQLITSPESSEPIYNSGRGSMPGLTHEPKQYYESPRATMKSYVHAPRKIVSLTEPESMPEPSSILKSSKNNEQIDSADSLSVVGTGVKQRAISFGEVETTEIESTNTADASVPRKSKRNRPNSHDFIAKLRKSMLADTINDRQALLDGLKQLEDMVKDSNDTQDALEEEKLKLEDELRLVKGQKILG